MPSIAQPSNVQGVILHPPLFIEVMHEVGEVMCRIISIIHSGILIEAKPDIQRLINKEHVPIDRPCPSILVHLITPLFPLNG